MQAAVAGVTRPPFEQPAMMALATCIAYWTGASAADGLYGLTAVLAAWAVWRYSR